MPYKIEWIEEYDGTNRLEFQTFQSKDEVIRALCNHIAFIVGDAVDVIRPDGTRI